MKTKNVISVLCAMVAATSLTACNSTDSNPTTPANGDTTSTHGVAAPTFSPASGSYSTPQTVVLQSSTAGASIFYTTDGTVPSEKSTLYSGSFQVSGTQTVMAIAIANGSPSQPAVATYVITSTPGTAPTLDGLSLAPQILLDGLEWDLGGTVTYKSSGVSLSSAISASNGSDVTSKFGIVLPKITNSSPAEFQGVLRNKTATPGDYTLHLTATDAIGKFHVDSIAFKVDSGKVLVATPDLMRSVEDGYMSSVVHLGSALYADSKGTIRLLASTGVLYGGGSDPTSTACIVDAGMEVLTTVGSVRRVIGTSNSQEAAAISGHYYAMRLATGEYAALHILSISRTGRNTKVFEQTFE